MSRIRQYFKRYSDDVQESLDFLEWIKGRILELPAPSATWTADSYRLVYGGFNPLSIAGSLACGGRFNVGGAQENHFFPNLKMRACLYTAASLECAKAEAGELIGVPQIYKIVPARPLKLWDLDSLIGDQINYPNLKSIIDSTPLAAIWAYQKVPKISQILAHYLRRLGGDGLVYPSTKIAKSTILAFFTKDDEQAKDLFSAQLCQ